MTARKKLFLCNTLILTGSSLLLRAGNIWFRTIICGRIGASGMGVYQLVLSVFALAITFCTSGAGMAVTRMVAEDSGSHGSIRRCLSFSLLLSIVAGATLWMGADSIAGSFVNSPQAAQPLRLLAPGLPFMAACSCLKGYFLAVRNTLLPALGEGLEQLVTIGAGLFLMGRMDPLSALMAGSTAGEIVSCAFIGVCYLVLTRRRPLCSKNTCGTGKLLHIVAPLLCSSFVRSLLSSTENLLIPRGLKRHGADADASLAQYGVIQGMVMPILFFPSSFLGAFSSLLIPELAQANAEGRAKSIERTAGRAIQYTVGFSFFASALLIVFADDLGTRLYQSEQAGQILRILAPILPLMYLDSVVDGMLKGLDQQLYSLKYNFSDSVMRVILITTLLPVFGIKAYLCILFASEIYNATLSIRRLLKVARVRVDIVGWIFTPALGAALLFYLLSLLRRFLL